jgi:hypothetical protein
VTIEQALSPPYPTIQLIRWAVLQFQIVTAEAIMVLSPLRSTPPLVVTDDSCQQVYRMYYIYGRNRFAFMVCIVPAIATLALFSEFGFPFVLYSPFSLDHDFAAISLWSVIMRQLVPDPTAPASIRQEFILSKVGFPINLL